MEDSMGQEIFNYGLRYGLVCAFVFGFTLRRIRDSRTAMGARNRPLDTFPDAAQPGSTPITIVRNSRRAAVFFVFWVIAFAIELIVFWQYTLYLQGYFAVHC
jgi:hypothetical protein